MSFADPASESSASALPPSAVPRAKLPWPALLALAASVFLSITIEMLPTGLLPEMSAGLGVPEPLIGLTVSVFAFVVVLTSAPLVAATSRLPRRGLLVGVLVVLALSTAASALAPAYWVLVVARVVGGLAHGVFWAIVAAAAARLVPDRLIGRAIAIVLGGGTLALVLGVPLATSLGQAFGWQLAFGLVAAVALVGAVVVRFALPAASPTDAPTASRFRRGDAGYGAVLVVCAVTAVVMLGQYAVFTYVAPVLTGLVGVPAAAVGPLLFVYGAAGAVGLVVAGSPLARHADAALLTSLALTIAALVALALAPGTALAVAAFVVWGLAFGAIPPLLQLRLLHAAPPSHRDAASALYTSGFNVGIGGGALVGAVVYGSAGVAGLPWAFVAFAAVATVALAVLAARGRAAGVRGR
ncbi:MFS transporter [Agromyces protaetiae]|uniref:MFS transporter n=1 Tax=Agromyces protaetiae TaxID=2509455 RepID=A0A4P6FC86_9MICO|nr:MFS transporter [Agromyces protaetiae]QAY73256.1 MFS transporter [Agromyces protaetiae]